MALPTTSLTCGQCGFVNEPERVYCHNCGSKLDRSLLPREDEGQAKESIDRTRRRVKKMTNPGSQILKREISAGIKTVIWSVVVAFVIQAVREPEGVPSAKNDAGLRMVGSELSDAVEANGPRQIAFTEPEINTYLRSAARAKAGASAIPGIIFDRAFVQFESGVCRVSIQQSLWGFPLYSGIAYRPEIKNGKFAPVLVGGNFGRVAVSPFLMNFASVAFQSLATVLKRDIAQMDRMRSIVVEKGRVTLVTKGTK